MPDPYERHARSPAVWGPLRSRSQQRAAAAAEQVLPEVVPEGKRPPAKKDPSLCKAAHWKGPHQPKLRVREYSWRKTPRCRWGIFWRQPEPSWDCSHEEVCAGCGKVLRTSIGKTECPDFHPITEEQRDALERELERWRQRGAARRRRPVIDGPQGYRKQKGV
jgi:hypothetical protein